MDHGEQRHQGPAFVLVSIALILGLMGSVPAFAGPSFDSSRFNIDVAASSDYVVHGITRSQGKPIVQAQLGWTGESGWTVGTWLASIDLNPGPGPRSEIDPFIAKRWLLSRDWSLRTDATRYMFRPNLQWASYDYTELRAALSFRDLLDVAAAWSPDYTSYSPVSGGFVANRTMLTYEASAHFPATRWLALNAGIGRRDLQEVFGHSYWYWSAGTEATFQRLSFALTYIGSSYQARELYSTEYAGNRVVATLGFRVR
jgi:uncharacterized protein (TIGR02001 family)